MDEGSGGYRTVRDAVTSCEDPEALKRWTRRAAAVGRAEEMRALERALMTQLGLFGLQFETTTAGLVFRIS
jgi:hypothetical protein